MIFAASVLRFDSVYILAIQWLLFNRTSKALWGVHIFAFRKDKNIRHFKVCNLINLYYLSFLALYVGI